MAKGYGFASIAVREIVCIGRDQDQEPVIAFLSGAQGGLSEKTDAEIKETHAAIVVLSGDYAYKIKRSVRFPYLDFSTLEKRRQTCLRELALNKPRAPEIYLDVVPITQDRFGKLAFAGEGAHIEWCVRMRRFSADNLLTAVAARGDLTFSLCKAIADAVYAAHSAAKVAEGIDIEMQLAKITDQVEVSLASAISSQPDPRRLASLCRQHLSQSASVLEKRNRNQCVRRCHGDLHLDNIVLWNGKPILFDAIEFSESIATIDTLYDLAFLLMDLSYRGDVSSANLILNHYLWRSQSRLDLEGLAALPLFLGLRAGIRAMTTLQRSELKSSAQCANSGLSEAQRYLDSAIRYVSPGRPELIAIGGLSGTGKTTLATALAPLLQFSPGAIHLRSDLERKSLFDYDELERLPPEAYDQKRSDEIYNLLAGKAAVCLAAGRTTIVDAVYGKPDERVEIEAVAKACDVPFTGLWLQAPHELLLQRVEQREADASDATACVVRQQAAIDAGAIAWHRISTEGRKEDLVARVLQLMDS